MIRVEILDGKTHPGAIRAARLAKWDAARQALREGDLDRYQRLLKEMAVLSSELKEFDTAVSLFNQAERIRRAMKSTMRAVLGG